MVYVRKDARRNSMQSFRLGLFALTTSTFAQDINGMNGNSMGPNTMAHKPNQETKMIMMQKQQTMKKQQMMQRNMCL
jgi:hypothetical protein